jgi:hypothetical protein
MQTENEEMIALTVNGVASFDGDPQMPLFGIYASRYHGCGIGLCGRARST